MIYLIAKKVFYSRDGMVFRVFEYSGLKTVFMLDLRIPNSRHENLHTE